LRVFLDWCRRNGVPGLLGEFGIPGHDAGWQIVMRKALAELPGTEVAACYWAAGEWWHDYALSLQPSDDFGQPAPQLAVLKESLGS
jgi:endoglucanase